MRRQGIDGKAVPLNGRLAESPLSSHLWWQEPLSTQMCDLGTPHVSTRSPFSGPVGGSYRQLVTKALSPLNGLMQFGMSLTSGEEGLGELTRNIRAVWIRHFHEPFARLRSARPDMTIPLVNRKLVVLATDASSKRS